MDKSKLAEVDLILRAQKLNAEATLRYRHDEIGAVGVKRILEYITALEQALEEAERRAWDAAWKAGVQRALWVATHKGIRSANTLEDEVLPLTFEHWKASLEKKDKDPRFAPATVTITKEELEASRRDPESAYIKLIEEKAKNLKPKE